MSGGIVDMIGTTPFAISVSTTSHKPVAISSYDLPMRISFVPNMTSATWPLAAVISRASGLGEPVIASLAVVPPTAA